MFPTSIYAVFVIDRTRKQMLLIKWLNLILLKTTIDQSNVQAVKTEKEEWYTLSNMIYIELQNCCFFIVEVYFEAPKMYINHLNNICNEVAMELQYMQLYQRYASLDKLLYFSRFLLRFVLWLSVRKFSKFYGLLFSRKPFSSSC